MCYAQMSDIQINESAVNRVKAIIWLLLGLAISYASQSQECNQIRITGNNDYPPIVWQNNKIPSRLDGVAVEYIESALSNIPVRFTTRYMGNWARAQLEVQDGKADILLAPYLTQGRLEWLNYFPVPILSDPVHLAYEAGNPKAITSWQDLIKLEGATPRGNSYGLEFDEFSKENLQITPTNTLEQSLTMLKRGRVDYVVYGLYPMMAETQRLNLDKQLMFSETPISSENIYIAMAKSSPCNKYFNTISRELEKLNEERVAQSLLVPNLLKWSRQHQ